MTFSALIKMENLNAPGSTAYKRLFDARTHWIRALESYFSPEDFRIEINACIQALRNVTFTLQADKSFIPNFEQWYGGWQSKMRADDKMKWSVEARNTIVKAKDLELNSKLRASLVGSYLDSEIPTFQTEYSPKITTSTILAEFRKKGVPSEYLEHSQLRIERRWVIKDFPTSEFLELLSHCWAFLSRVLADLPGGSSDSSLVESWGLPPCMVDNGEFRSHWIKISTGKASILNTSTIDVNRKNISTRQAESIKKYGLDNLQSPKKTGNALYDQAYYFLEIGKTALKVDGHHNFFVILLTKNNNAVVLQLQPKDRSDKYRMWQAVASDVKRNQAHSLICISEAWTATIPADQPVQHASEVPNRGEALKLIVASADGEGLVLIAPFTRIGEEIVIHETIEHGLDSIHVNVIEPVLTAWKEMAEARKIGD